MSLMSSGTPILLTMSISFPHPARNCELNSQVIERLFSFHEIVSYGTSSWAVGRPSSTSYGPISALLRTLTGTPSSRTSSLAPVLTLGSGPGISVSCRNLSWVRTQKNILHDLHLTLV